MEMDDSRALALVAAHSNSRDQVAAPSSSYGSFPLAIAGPHPTGTSSHAYTSQAAHPSTASTSSQPHANNMVALSGGMAGPLALGQQSTSSSAGSTALKNIPAFLNKLYSMVNDPATNDLIRWTDLGNSFIVPNSDKVARELLPRFFKHSNFGSFVRQLNMYGFHKVPHLQQGVLKVDGDGEKEKAETLEFRNENFQRDQPDLMYLIQRKKGAAGTMPTGSGHSGLASLEGAGGDGSHEGLSIANEPFSAGGATAPSSLGAPNPAALSKFQNEVAAILSEVTAIKRHQAILSTELRDLQSNNTQLWQHSIENRQRHEKNGDLIDKILKFLAGVYGGRALSEGAGFSSSSIDSAIKGNSRPSTPGSHTGHGGMGNASQHAQGTNNKQHHHQPYRQQHHPQASTSKSNDMELVPSTSRKRQRLLIEASPAKERFQSAASTATSVSNDDDSPAVGSYFEEIPSDGETEVRAEGSTRPPRRNTSNESLNRQAAIERLSASPANQASSRFESLPASDDPFHQKPRALQQQTSGGSYESEDLTNRQLALPLPSPSYYQQLLDSASNGAFDFNDPDFLSSIGLGGSNGLPPISSGTSTAAPPTSLPSASPSTAQSTVAPSPSDLALSLQPTYGMAPSPMSSLPITNPQPNGQALTKYNSSLQSATEENERLKTRMDSLSEAIDKLVGQLPQGFDFSSLGLGNNEPGTTQSNSRSQNGLNGSSAGPGNGEGLADEFDFSQYLDNADDYSGMTVDQQPGGQTEEQQRLNDSLAKYLDPELADTSYDADPQQAASIGSEETIRPSEPSPSQQIPQPVPVKDEGQAMTPTLPTEDSVAPPHLSAAAAEPTLSAQLQPPDADGAVAATPASTKQAKKRKSSVPVDALQAQDQQSAKGKGSGTKSSMGEDSSTSPQPRSDGENASVRPRRRSSRVPSSKR